MNTFTAVVNLTRDPEDLVLGERELVKMRLADNTFGKGAETRFFDALVGGPDVEIARQLKSGNEIVISGTLVKTSYKGKKGKMKGKTVEADSMPFAKILKVTRSPSFFAQGGDEESDAINTEAPDLEAPADDAIGDDPLADVY